MTNPQQPGGWTDPSWSAEPPTTPQPDAGYPGSGAGYPGYPGSGAPIAPPPPPAQLSPTQSYPAPGYPEQAYPGADQQVPAYAPAGYLGYGYPVARPTNGMSIAAMVVSIVATVGLCVYGLGGYLGIVGAILGHVASRKIRESGEQGEGMAKAGIIIGWITTGISVLATIALVIFFVWLANQDTSSTSTY